MPRHRAGARARRDRRRRGPGGSVAGQRRYRREQWAQEKERMAKKQKRPDRARILSKVGLFKRMVLRVKWWFGGG